MSGAVDGARVQRVRVPAVAIAALVLLVLGVLSLAPAVSTYLTQQRAIADAKARIADQRADLADMAEQRARWADPAYIRAQASSRLFYVVPGTTAYRVIDSTATDAPAAAAQPTSSAWTETLLQSLVAAGTTTEPAG